MSGAPILIWGAGAIGGTLGAAFIRAGHAVTFVDREAAHVEAINARGLRIAGPMFEEEFLSWTRNADRNSRSSVA